MPRLRRLGPLICDEESPEGLGEFKKWFRRWRPDAVISSGSTQHGWLLEMGLKVPRDCGFAHLNLGSDVAGWAGVDPQTQWIAASAVDMLVGQIHRHETGVPPVPKELLIKGLWVQGNTVRAQG